MPDDPTGDLPIRAPRRPKKQTGNRRGGDRHSEAARVEAAARRRKVMQLRMAGVDFEAIAEQTGYADSSGAWRAWKDGMDSVVRTVAQEAVDLELQRYDALLRAVIPKALAGNLGAVDRVLAISAARRKLLGLDSAVKIDLSTDEAREEVRGVAAELVGLLDQSGLT